MKSEKENSGNVNFRKKNAYLCTLKPENVPDKSGCGAVG